MLFRYSFRSLFRKPLPAVTAAGSLAAALGLSLALASVSDAVLFRPLPVPDADRVVRIFTASKLHSLGFSSYPDFEEYAKAGAFSGIAADCKVTLAIGMAGEPPQMRLGLSVSPKYFDVLEIPAFRGRMFRPEDERSAVIVLSHSLWRTRFGGREDVIGKVILAGARPFTVVGIAPPNYGLDPFFHEDFYVLASAYAAGLLPGTSNPFVDRSRRFLSIYARLAPQASLSQAQAELSAIASRLSEQYPATNHDSTALVLSDVNARKRANAPMKAMAEALLAGAVLVLLVACVNVSGLLLLQGEARLGEFVLRFALGERRGLLLASRLAESGWVATMSLAVSLVFAAGVFRAVRKVAALPSDLPVALQLSLDHRLFAASALATMLMAFGCALLPWMALVSARESQSLARSSFRATSSGSMRTALVVLQVTMATVLLTASGNLLQDWLERRAINLGYEPRGILTLAFDPAQVRSSADQGRQFYRQVLGTVASVPGVTETAFAQSVPLGITGAQRFARMDGREEGISAWINIVTPEYFGLLRLPMLAGRTFAQEDREHAPAVAIVNETMAHNWPDGNAVGRRIEVDGRAVQIVGIVRTIDYFELGELPKPMLYLPFEQNYTSRMVLHVRTGGDEAALAPAILTVLPKINPNQPVSDVRPLSEYRERAGLMGARIGSFLIAMVAALSILLALSGVAAMVSHIIRLRGREVAIRCALGAGFFTTAHAILRPVFLASAGGAALGVAGYRLVERSIRSLIYIHSPGGGIPLALVSAGLVLSASLAVCVIPLLRAYQSEPAVTLRQD